MALSPVPIPARFRAVRYDGSRYPGSEGGLELGANCQKFAYEFIRHYGCVIPDFRSAELWADTSFTHAVADAAELKPLDLVLFHNRPEAWGAHVGVFLGQELVLHLAKQVGSPALWSFMDFGCRPEYAFYTGAKRTLRKKSAIGEP